MKVKTQKSQSTTSASVGHIKNGVMQSLYAIKICDSNKVQKHIKLLEQSSLVISKTDGYQINIKQDFFDARYEEMSERVEDTKLHMEQMMCEENLPFENISIRAIRNDEIHPNENYNGFRIMLVDTLSETVKKHMDALIKDMNANIKNEAFLRLGRKDLLLYPITIHKNNDEIILFNILSIFESGLAILRMEYEMCDVGIAELSGESLDLSFESYDLPLCYSDEQTQQFGYYHVESDGNEHDIQAMLVRTISGIVKSPILVGDRYKIILVNDYTSRPQDTGSITSEYEKDIVYMLASPVSPYSEPSKEHLRQIINDSHYEINKYVHVYVSTAPKLIVSHVGNMESLLKIQYDLDDAESQYIVGRSMLQGVTPAVEAVLLKYFINSEISDKCCNISNKSLQELLTIKMEIHRLTLFEVNNYKFRFDTMTKLSEFIDKRHTYHLSNDKVNKLINSFNDVVTTRESINNERTSMLLSVIGIIIAILLSFTGIRDIVEFVNSKYLFVSGDDLVSIFNITIKVWILTVALILISIILVRKKIKFYKKNK